MADPRFFDNHGPLTLAAIVKLTGAEVGLDTGAEAHDVAPLENAGPRQLAFCDNPKMKNALSRTGASIVVATRELIDAAPEGVARLVSDRPSLAFAKIAGALYPGASLTWPMGKPPLLPVDPSARIGAGSTLALGVQIGADVEIGRDCVIGAGAVIGRGVQIGHGAFIGPHVSISHALIGDRVFIHAGSRIGQDGFGYVGSPSGHFKIPQLGRVIIQDGVEIGANCCIDRGALADTVIGEGTKIDNLVQIGHNTRVGRHCILVSEVGLSGSIELGDFVVLGGQVGVADHVKIGTGAQVAAKAGVTGNLPGGQVYGGFPAKPVGQWRREMGALSLFAKGKLRRNVSSSGKN
ncbi:MAG: UDP-3-O-(3-hydroxymyristoyl)glucosamine N-acyltransferase [Alphaproteobacteria bacterium]|nr:UDP-3-O-(3-hydroxymyristoyl)glucosamine N-acyltransferase [Alphaproteobacteria bacterium]